MRRFCHSNAMEPKQNSEQYNQAAGLDGARLHAAPYLRGGKREFRFSQRDECDYDGKPPPSFTAEQVALVREALKYLSEGDWQLLIAHEIEGRTVREIATILSCHNGTVSRRKKALLAGLRRLVRTLKECVSTDDIAA